jgi:hypothetical protein
MMSQQAAARRNPGEPGARHPWPGRSGLVPGNIRSLPITVDPDVLIFFLGDLVGRKLRVSAAAAHLDPLDIEPGRVTIRVDGQNRIVDMWVDADEAETH